MLGRIFAMLVQGCLGLGICKDTEPVPLQNSSRCLNCSFAGCLRGSVIFVDHTAEYFPALNRCVTRNDDRPERQVADF